MKKWVSEFITRGWLLLSTLTMLMAFPPNIPMAGRMFGGFVIGFSLYSAGYRHGILKRK